MNHQHPWEPPILKQLHFWITWASIATLVAATLFIYLGFVADRAERLMNAKIAVEKELATERARPGLTPWEPVEVTYYADHFHGKVAANGSTFSQNLPTCATTIRALLGKVVVVRSQDGKRLVPLIVTDILPEERMDRLDVSAYAAQRLGITVNGRVTLMAARVEVER